MTNELKLTLRYEERTAIDVVRKMLKRRPELAACLLDGMSKEVAVTVLQQGQKELADMLVVSRALSEAAGKLALELRETSC